MNLKQEKRYLKKRIEGIEGAISVHQDAIDFHNPCDVEIKCRQECIEELMVDLEAYRYYLNYLNSVVVPIRNTSNGNIYYKTKCYNDGRLVRQICTGERCGSHPYD